LVLDLSKKCRYEKNILCRLEGWQVPVASYLDGFVKSPSAALRCNFVVAAHLLVRLTPQFLRAQSRLRRESFLRDHLS
jgi:hypothetical protein